MRQSALPFSTIDARELGHLVHRRPQPRQQAQAVAAKLGAALRVATSDETVRARLAEQGIEAWSGDAAILRETLARDTEIWTKVIRDNNITVE